MTQRAIVATRVARRPTGDAMKLALLTATLVALA
jgi:hypothetical protein